MRIWLVTACVLGLSFPADAQQIYKCKRPDGTHVYQQAGCPDNTSTSQVRRYRPEANSSPYLHQTPQERVAAYSPAVPRGGYAPAEAPVTATISAGAQERYLTRAEEDAQRRLQRRADRASRADTSVIQSGPRTVTDQFGNRYQQAPGSAFVTDEKTGKQCFQYGNFIECR